MSIRYYDRLNRFGIEFDTKYGSRLIFPEEYYPDFVSRYHFDPFKFRYFTQQFMSEPTLFLYSAYQRVSEREENLGNMLYPSGIGILVDFVLGPDDQNLIEVHVDGMEHLSGGVQTIFGRQKPNGSTKEEIIEDIMRQIRVAVENKIDFFGAGKLIAERFTAKPVESNNWKSFPDA